MKTQSTSEWSFDKLR